MITVEQLKKGLAAYVDSEFTAKLPGLKKWGVALVATPMIATIDNQILRYHDMLKASGYITDDMMVDIDKLHEDAASIADKTGSVTQHIPVIGDVTFSKSDIDKLYHFTKGDI